MKKYSPVGLLLLIALLVSYCGGTSSTSTSTCTQSANTTATGATASGTSGSCNMLTRDTSACKASRQAQGLTGNWLNFSCRVTLTLSGGNVTIVTDSQPDYSSTYYSTSSACYTKQTTTYPDPNTIIAQSLSMTVPFAPTSTSGAAMGGGTVGVALNGVVIYDQVAAGTDNIYDEAGSFDYCQGHPQDSGQYHYHTEPLSISYNDSNLIGVARDGYFIYGRKDSDSSLATGGTNGAWLSTYGGHVGVPPVGGSSIFHYHAHVQTGNNGSGVSKTVYFLLGNGVNTTSANYYGTAGTCTGC